MNLTLLNAALLGGLATIILPTIVHLLSRRRARRVRFAPMELLMRSQKRTARSIRLRQLLLLVVRTLFIFGLAAAVLRPLLSDEPVAGSTSAPVVVVVAIDVSASMQARLDGRTAFDLARAKANEAVNGLPEDVRVGLVACDAEPRDLVVPGFDRPAVIAALEALTVGAAWADVAACAERAAGLATTVEVEGEANSAGERRVVIVSDFAAHGFSRGSTGAVDAKGLRIDLLPAFDEAAPPNHGILDIEVTPGAQGLGVRFTAARYGGPDVEVAADLFVGEARGARLALPFSSGAPLERTFTAPNAPKATADTPAFVAGTLTVALGDDALALDNVVVLPNEERASVSVLVVDGEPDAVPFSDEVYYLTQALSSSRAGIAGQSRLAVNVLAPEKVDAASLVGVDVLILANVARLSQPASAAVVSHVEAGGGLLLTMGDQVDVDAYNRQLGAVLPAVLRGVKRQTLLDDASVSEFTKDAGHVALAVPEVLQIGGDEPAASVSEQLREHVSAGANTGDGPQPQTNQRRARCRQRKRLRRRRFEFLRRFCFGPRHTVGPQRRRHRVKRGRDVGRRRLEEPMQAARRDAVRVGDAPANDLVLQAGIVAKEPRRKHDQRLGVDGHVGMVSDDTRDAELRPQAPAEVDDELRDGFRHRRPRLQCERQTGQSQAQAARL